jgi:hypothetical protein
MNTQTQGTLVKVIVKELDQCCRRIHIRSITKQCHQKINDVNKYYKENQIHDDIQTNNDDQYNETKKKLTLLLDSSHSNKIHAENIMKLSTLKDAHIYCKTYNLSGQYTGPILEKYIKFKYNMTKNKSSLCNGDLKINETNIEIKSSNGGKENNKFNFVQIRMNHNCEYILTAYYIDYSNLETLGELFIFKLNKENIKSIILKYGGYAHGTIGELGKITKEDLDDVKNNQKEYAIRAKYGDKCWNELLKFRIDTFHTRIYSYYAYCNSII